jgi:predicted transcriptional regulator of viral defense system
MEGKPRLRARDIMGWLAAEGVEVFTIDDLVDRFDVPRQTARAAAARMTEANQVRRLKRGVYLVLEPNHWNHPETPLVANWHLLARYLAAPDPYYLAYYTAMELHRMIQHPLTTVFVATTVQKDALTVGPVRFRFVTVTPSKFFGFEQRQFERGKAVELADLERTFLDCVDRLDLCGGIEEVARGFARRNADLNRERLLRYVLQLDRPVATKRLGYLLEITGHRDPKLLRELERLAGTLKHYAPLVPGVDTAGAERSKRWELIVNADADRLMETLRT